MFHAVKLLILMTNSKNYGGNDSENLPSICFFIKYLKIWLKSLQNKKFFVPLQPQKRNRPIKAKKWCHSSVGRAKD